MKCRMDYATSTFKFCITLQYAHFLSSSIKEENILFSDKSILESLRLWQTTKRKPWNFAKLKYILWPFEYGYSFINNNTRRTFIVINIIWPFTQVYKKNIDLVVPIEFLFRNLLCNELNWRLSFIVSKSASSNWFTCQPNIQC